MPTEEFKNPVDLSDGAMIMGNASQPLWDILNWFPRIDNGSSDSILLTQVKSKGKDDKTGEIGHSELEMSEITELFEKAKQTIQVTLIIVIVDSLSYSLSLSLQNTYPICPLFVF